MRKIELSPPALDPYDPRNSSQLLLASIRVGAQEGKAEHVCKAFE